MLVPRQGRRERQYQLGIGATEDAASGRAARPDGTVVVSPNPPSSAAARVACQAPEEPAALPGDEAKLERQPREPVELRAREQSRLGDAELDIRGEEVERVVELPRARKPLRVAVENVEAANTPVAVPADDERVQPLDGPRRGRLPARQPIEKRSEDVRLAAGRRACRSSLSRGLPPSLGGQLPRVRSNPT